MRQFIIAVSSVVALFLGASAGAADVVEGRDFTTVRPKQATDDPSKIVVTEFFSYQCPHCYAFSRSLAEWIAKLPADVICRREAVSIGHASWEPIARTFYALDALGKLPTLDATIFNAIHEKRMILNTEDAIANWLATNGVTANKFKATYRSFGVDVKWQRGQQMAAAHRIPSVPVIAIDGKYLVEIVGNIDFAKQLGNVDALIKMVRVERAAKK